MIARLFALALFFLLTPATLHAHAFNPALLDIHEQHGGRFEVHWSSSGAFVTRGDFEPSFPAHCEVVFDDPVTTSGSFSRFGVAECGEKNLYNGVISVGGLSVYPIDVIVRIHWQNRDTLTHRLSANTPSWRVPSRIESEEAGGAQSVFWTYLKLGAEHILLGWDHLFFVLGLLLLVGDVRALLWTITSFSLAHSLTLSAAMMSWASLPPQPVEGAIALSILLLASELARAPRDAAAAPMTLTRRWPWLVAFSFGLLHGFGFSGALAEIGLPPGEAPWALFSFNAGVELGQVVFVLAFLTIKKYRLPEPVARGLRVATIYAMGSCSVMWLLQRL